MEKPQGKIISFYSYKGGTGRSMALANMAWILASFGKQVLVVDWDLEAPGLHRYFAPFLNDKDLTSTDGLIDMVSEFAMATISPPETATDGKSKTEDKKWYEDYADILNYAISLNWDFPNKGTLDLMPAGRQGDSYSARVNSFNWQDFYDRRGGGVFLEAVKERMQAEYDYILIDSRTGVSDTSGICTVQMPDVVVVCFTLNNQGMKGAAAVARSIYEQRLKEGKPVEIFPVPMRVEPFEKTKLDLRREHAKRYFGLFPASLSQPQRAQFQEDVQVQYLPYYAYEEILAAFGNKPGDAISLLAPSERLAEYLTEYLTPGEKIGRLVLTESLERQREIILARYEGKEIEPDVGSPEYLIRVADAAFANLSPAEEDLARRAILRMIRYARPDESDGHARVKLKLWRFEEDTTQVLRKLADSHLLNREGEPGSQEETVQIASDDILRGWKRLNEWIELDSDFLLWRQQLRGRMTEWETGRGTLLTEAPLEIAKRFSELRKDDLNERELIYIAGSIREEERKQAHTSAIEQQLKDEREQKSSLEQQKLSLEQAQSKQLRKSRWGLAIVIPIILLGLLIIAAISYQVYQKQKQLTAVTAEQNVLAQASSLTIDGVALSKQGNNDAALAKFEEAINLKPDYAEAFFQKANALRNNKDYEHAIGTYDQALALKPDFAEAALNRGLAYSSNNKFDNAIQNFTQVITANPNDKAVLTAAYRNRADAYQQKNDLDNAINDYSEALKLTPDDVLSLLGRGTSLSKKSNKVSATTDYQAALNVAASKNDVPNSESARAGLKQLGVKAPIAATPVPKPDTASVPARIFLHYQDAKDENTLDGISRALSAQGYAAPRKQKVTQPTSGDIRYFYPEDQAAAEKIKQTVQRNLQQQGIKQNLELTFLSSSAAKAPRGQIEVWLPPLPAVETQTAPMAQYPPRLKSKQPEKLDQPRYKN